MLKPIEKPTRRPLIHHPSDVLDSFCQYDQADPHWTAFDEEISVQIRQFETDNQRYIRVRPTYDRASR
jgi:hypothetical protein